MKQEGHEAFGACIEKHFPAPIPPTGTVPSAVRERERLLAIMCECFHAGAAWQREQSAPERVSVDRALIERFAHGRSSFEDIRLLQEFLASHGRGEA